MTYSQHLRELNLGTSSNSHLWGDMITIFQILHGSIDMKEGLLQLSNTKNTQGDHLKLHKSRAKSQAGRNFPSVRAVNSWNGLPFSVISAPFLNIFKSQLDSHWEDIHFISVFDE